MRAASVSAAPGRSSLAAESPWTLGGLSVREHRVAEPYNMVNVPRAVWIDETGHIVRPTESAGAYEGSRSMDRRTFKMPDEVAAVTSRAQADVRGGRERAAARLERPDENVALAHAHFRLGQCLARRGKAMEAREHFAEARWLHPGSWNIWRQTAALDARGLVSGPEFWARVDALGSRRYYAPVDMPGMPS